MIAIHQLATPTIRKTSVRKTFGKLAIYCFMFPALGLPQSTPIDTAIQVPTTHVLAIGRFVRPLTPQEQWKIMPQEVQETLRLMLDGKIEQGWVRKDQKGAVFLINATSVEDAHAMLENLPLGKAKLMEFELLPVGPLGPLRMLLDKSSAPSR